MRDPNWKPWQKGPGECHDARGVPIHPGDLLRTPHFTDRCGQKHYLYHVAVLTPDGMQMMNVAELEPTTRGGGGCPWLSDNLAQNATIIHGYGPGDCLDYTDRPKLKREPV
jgi:hypothetical protein